jgi:hypothetical protein
MSQSDIEKEIYLQQSQMETRGLLFHPGVLCQVCVGHSGSSSELPPLSNVRL